MSDTFSFRRTRLTPEQLLFYLHIERTGGNSARYIIENTFEYVLESSRICPAFHWHQLEQVDPARAREFDLLRGHFTYGDGPPFYRDLPRRLARILAAKQTIYATCLRHPVERAVSQYRHIQSASDHYMHPRAAGMSLAEFVRDDWTRNAIANYQTKSVVLATCPGADPAALPDEELLARATDSLARFALVGITEQMGASLRLLTFVLHWSVGELRERMRARLFPRRSDWPPTAPPDPAEALRLNVGEARDGALDDSLRREIEECNALDLELYATALERFEAQIAWMNDAAAQAVAGKIPS